MKSTALATLTLAPALSVAQNATYLGGLLAALESANLTKLISVAEMVNGTSVGQSLLANISDGSPFTIFAPYNDGWPSNLTTNATVLADVFSYHVLPGNLSDFPTCYPNVTLARTLYNDPLTVRLEGGKSQVVAWSTRADGKVHVLNQPSDPYVKDTISYGNLTIFVIDHSLQVPENLNDTIATNPWMNATEAVLKSATLSFYNATTNSTGDVTFFDALNEGYHGFTAFWPDNDAIGAANATLASIASNRTALNDALFNHIINATTLYSPLLEGSQNYTTAAGEVLSFSINSTGQYVTRGNITAQIVQPDVLLPNGVIHIIDTVLADTENDPSAGSSALSSALAAATSSEPAQTVPIGFALTSSLATAVPTSTAGTGADSSSAATSSVTDMTSTTETASASGSSGTTVVVGGGSGGGSTSILTAPGIVSTLSAGAASGTGSASSISTSVGGGAGVFTTTVTNSDGSVSTSVGASSVSVTSASDASSTSVAGAGGLFTTTVTNSDGSVSTSTGTSAGESTVTTTSTATADASGASSTSAAVESTSTSISTATVSTTSDSVVSTTTATTTPSTDPQGGIVNSDDSNGAVSSRNALGFLVAAVAAVCGGFMTAS